MVKGYKLLLIVVHVSTPKRRGVLSSFYALHLIVLRNRGATALRN